MVYRIEVRVKDTLSDPHAGGVLAQIRELGITAAKSVRHARVFFVIGQLTDEQLRRVADELLADPIVEDFTIVPPGTAVAGVGGGPSGLESQGDIALTDPVAPAVIEVHLKAGVMDPVAASTEKAITDMGLPAVAVRTGRRYELSGKITPEQRAAIARKLLANDCIEDVHFAAFNPPEPQPHQYVLKVREVPIRDLDDAGLEKLSAEMDLFLNLTEMKAIQDYFRSLGREPRDVEVEMIAQTWSEHCVHKTFRSDVRVTDKAGRIVEEIPNLIKSTIFGATARLNKPWCISVFKDNAGVIEFDEQNAVCFKVETHNHPSALDPYGGAGTGIGGVIRDPMGTGMGAFPVANTDVFCFGPTDMPAGDVPKGVLHPRRVMRGVVAGVRDYGNRMGIPTINGAVYFDEKYVGNPLVFCGTVGILPKDKAFKKVGAGDAVVVVGGRTGRDGIHGATFSSGELTHEHETEFSGAVQIGNAITEKKVLDTIMQARDAGLYTAITDCGAGGLSSAVGEMGEELGAEVHLDRVPLKYAGLRYDEIWISEAQERMVLSVPQANVERILAVFRDEDVEATVIGHFGTPERKLRLLYGGQVVCELDTAFLGEGLPRPTKSAVWEKVSRPSPQPRERKSYNRTLLRILAAPNVASKEWIIRQYDHEVQGGSVIKPLLGVGGDAPSDAAVFRPVLGSSKGVAVSCGMNPRLGDLDPYQSALHAIDEALRNIVAVGGNLDRTAILDNFCWGNCNKPDRMGSLVQAAKACYDGALAYGTPFISGKDSLNNEFKTDSGQTIAIPPTLLISAISVVDDVHKCVSSDAKTPGDLLYLVGATSGHLGGSHFFLAEGLKTGTDVPPVDVSASRRAMLAVQQAISAGLVRACHDLSEGGLAVAAAEMAFAGALGVEIDIAAIPVASAAGGPSAVDIDVAQPPSAVQKGKQAKPAKAPKVDISARLFNEAAGRFLVEVTPENAAAFEKLIAGLPAAQVGLVLDTPEIIFINDGPEVLKVTCKEAKQAWQGTFKW